MRFLLILFLSLGLSYCGERHESERNTIEEASKEFLDSDPMQPVSTVNLYTSGDHLGQIPELKCGDSQRCQILARTQFSFQNSNYDIMITNDRGILYYQEYKAQKLQIKDKLSQSKIRQVCEVGGSCSIDTMAYQPQWKWLSVTGNGHYWNFEIQKVLATQTDKVKALNNNPLLSVDRYANGPCHPSVRGSKACKFDSRTLINYKSGSNLEVVESITAYGRYWNYAKRVPFKHTVTDSGQVIGKDLTTVNRYRNGPCNGKSANSCTFDTRTVFTDKNYNRL